MPGRESAAAVRGGTEPSAWSGILRQQIRHFVAGFDLRVSSKWFVLSAAIGVIAGLGAIAFQFLTQFVLHYSLGEVAGYLPREAAGEHSYFERREKPMLPWAIVGVMVSGGLVSGYLVYRFAPEAEGHGTDAVIDAFHNKGGRIRGRIPIIKTITSAITIGTGGSGGREGPIAQIGAGFGSFLAGRLGLSSRDRRILVAAGMGAGVGAIFRAPLAGALFAGEILYKDAEFESDVIIPSALSSIIGYSVYSLALPREQRFVPLFGSALNFEPLGLLQLLPMAAMAILLVLAGILYIKSFYGIHRLFKSLPIIPHVKPALGAALAGTLGIGLYYLMGRDVRVLAVLSTGYGTLQQALRPPETGPLAIQLLLTVALAKIVTTSLTIGSGGSGGVFGPSMVIGGCLGGAIGQFFHRHWPWFVDRPEAYAIVGMAGFFAGCAHAPFSTVIMVSEMTGNYSLLLPSMWVCALCFLFCRRWTLYLKQVPSRLESAAHRGDFIIDVLEGIKVQDVYQKDRKLISIHEGQSLDEIVHTLARTHQHYYPVVDREGRFVGIFSSDDVRSYLYDETIWQLAVARDLMVTDIISVTPEDDLNTALRRFTALNIDELPVLDPRDPGKLLGMLRRKETIAFYNRRLMEYKQQASLAE